MCVWVLFYNKSQTGILTKLMFTQPPVEPHPNPNTPITPFLPPSTVSSDDASSQIEEASSSSMTTEEKREHDVSNASPLSQSTSTTKSVALNKPLCNFVFPKYFQWNETIENDPVDEMLQQVAASEVMAATTTQSLREWDLEETLLGQYLIFGEEDATNLEQV